MADITFSQLATQLTGDPTDRTKIHFGADDSNAATTTKEVQLPEMEVWTNKYVVSTLISALDASFTHPVLAAVAKPGDWVAVDAFTTGCEFRRIESLSGDVITVNRKFMFAHAVNDVIVHTQSAWRNVVYFGADADAASIHTNVQAALNDFDYRLDTTAGRASATFTVDVPTNVCTSTAHGLQDTQAIFLTTTGTLPPPLTTTDLFFVRDKSANTFKLAWSPNGTEIDLLTGESGTHTWNAQADVQPNNLFFPPGTWTLGGQVVLPERHANYGLAAIVTGNNATIRTSSYTGPLFKSAADDDVRGSSNFWFFNLAFRDETTPRGTAGTATLFAHNTLRLRFERNSCVGFLNFVLSTSLTNNQHHIQSWRIYNNFFVSNEFIVQVAKAWDFKFVNNVCEFNNKVVHTLITTETSMVQGVIRDNVMEGSGTGGETILIRGPQQFSFEGNYLESNGDTSQGEINLTGGTTANGVRIRGNRFSSVATTQAQDASWYVVEVLSSTHNLTVSDNYSDAPLLNPVALANTNSTKLENNTVIFDTPQSQQREYIAKGHRTIHRAAELNTTDATATNVDFGLGAEAWNVADAHASGSSVTIKAYVTAVHTNLQESADWAIVGHFRDRESAAPATRFVAVGTVGDIYTKIDDGTNTWDIDLVLAEDVAEVTSVDTGTDTLTSATHGLSNGTKIYLTGADLPAPLVENKAYFVQGAATNTFTLSRNPTGGNAIDLTDAGTGSHYWHHERVDLECTGQAGNNIRWKARVEIEVTSNV